MWGIWNGMTPRADAQVARVSAVLRYFQPLMARRRVRAQALGPHACNRRTCCRLLPSSSRFTPL